jgi:hypothetical protein
MLNATSTSNGITYDIIYDTTAIGISGSYLLSVIGLFKINIPGTSLL